MFCVPFVLRFLLIEMPQIIFATEVNLKQNNNLELRIFSTFISLAFIQLKNPVMCASSHVQEVYL